MPRFVYLVFGEYSTQTNRGIYTMSSLHQNTDVYVSLFIFLYFI